MRGSLSPFFILFPLYYYKPKAMKKIEVFETVDGQLFKDKKDATKHERQVKKDMYISDGKYSVYCGKVEIARSYVGGEVRILQGMPRMETLAKVVKDCPEFAAYNKIDLNIVPKLYPSDTIKVKKERKKRFDEWIKNKE